MKLKIKLIIRHFFQKIGLHLRFTENSNLISEFLEICYPKSTDIPLIRIGEELDGGYLLPDDLDGIDACFSPGVEQTATFELEMAKRGIKSFMADYSVNGPPFENELFSFEKKYIGYQENEVFTTMDKWVKKHSKPSESNFLLQMDIEGWEYDSLLHTSDETISKFRIMVIEFHGLDMVFDPLGLKILKATFSKLLLNHTIVHIHPNNISPIVKYKNFEIPPTIEFTFLRNDRIKKSEFTTHFPHKFDTICIPNLPDFPLPKCWYSKGL
jgi:hypothetical protein